MSRTRKRSHSEIDKGDRERIFTECLSIITPNYIKKKTDSGSLNRCEDYINDFQETKLCVLSLEKRRYKIKGECERCSTYGPPYKVSLTVDCLNKSEKVDAECDCPSPYYWCKHMAALGFTFAQYNSGFDFIPVTIKSKKQKTNPPSKLTSNFVYIVVAEETYIGCDKEESLDIPPHCEAQILGVYNSMDDADKKANSLISLGDGDKVIESREDDSVFYTIRNSTKPLSLTTIIYVSKHFVL